MRRSRLERIVDVLRVLAHGQSLKITEIMRKANINCGVLKEDLEILTERNLVQTVFLGKDRRVYKATPKCFEILQHHRELVTAIEGNPWGLRQGSPRIGHGR